MANFSMSHRITEYEAEMWLHSLGIEVARVRMEYDMRNDLMEYSAALQDGFIVGPFPTKESLYTALRILTS